NIYSSLADAEENDERREAYVDSLMLMYDLRMKYCGEEASIMDRKALYAFKYNYKNKEKSAWILEIYDNMAKVTGKDMMDANLKYYMTAVQLNRVYHKALTDEEILDRYNKIQEFIDAKIAEGGDRKKLESIRESVTDILVKLVEMTCDQVKETLGPKFKQNPDDITTAKNIFRFMLQDKCTDDPLWLEAAIKIFEVEPDYGLVKNIALKFRKSEEDDKAEFYFREALKLATDPADKADMYIQLGHLDREQGKKSDAREMYRNALSADPSQKEVYRYIGILYLNSFNECKQEKSMVEDRAVYLAAYKMFKLAGDTGQMNAAKEQFPSVGNVFEENKQKGQTITVGCWINETVVLDTRD
ncbi:MAG: hypothetical protein OEY51_03360, partial [Cyclobacteriaceae bacterium]|nr:hypothetical protein [Cyclobacteriaceae bacterium]